MKRIVIHVFGVCAVAGLLGVFGCGGGIETGVPTDLTPGVPADKLPKLLPMTPGKAPAEPKADAAKGAKP